MKMAATPAGSPGPGQRHAQLGLLGAGMGHDMRNAIMPMLLHLDLLDRAADTSVPSPGLDTRHLVENLQRLANGLLLRTTESGSAPPASALHLHAWWDDVGDLIRTTLPRACTLQVNIAPTLPQVLAQPAVLAQVMLHLLVNVHLALDADSDGMVSITAARSRRGISLLVQDEPVRSAPASGDAARLTATWGMALARTLLQRSGGDITGHSVIGHGTHVTIHLRAAPPGGDEAQSPAPGRPFVRSARSASPSPPTAVRRTGTAPDTVSVLCIDDNAALTAALALRLGMDDRFEFLPPLHSLDDSIARITALAPSVVLLDLNLPGVERPLDVIRALREGGTGTRVLVLTGNPSTEAVRATRDAGAHGFIAKGVSPDRLVAALLRVGDGEFVLELDS